MKTIWARVGMSVEVTDKQYEELRQLALNEEYDEEYEVYDDLELPDWLLVKFEKKGKIDGDCYIPGDCW